MGGLVDAHGNIRRTIGTRNAPIFGGHALDNGQLILQGFAHLRLHRTRRGNIVQVDAAANSGSNRSFMPVPPRRDAPHSTALGIKGMRKEH
jgi:hypothetical protein